MGRTEVKLRGKPSLIHAAHRGGLFPSDTIEGAEVLLGKPDFVTTRRPPNVAARAAFQKPATVVYFHERALAFVAIAGGAFLGHCGNPITR